MTVRQAHVFIGPQAEWPAAGTQHADHVYFATDTRKVYQGGTSWTEVGAGGGGGGTQAFPVGSIFIAIVATNPATLLGYGTWIAFGTGRMMIGIDPSQTEFDTVREIGGVKTVTLTTAEMPAHTHNQQRHATATGALTGITTAPDTSSSSPAAMGPATASTGGGAPHANMPPYIVCHFWERTA